MEVTKCLERTDGIKYAIIRKKSDIKKGDNIGIVKINEEEVKKNDKRRRKSS